MPRFRIGSRSDLPLPNEAKEFNAGERVICVANCGGVCSAMDNTCQHRGGPLGQGVVMEGKVICPWHGWAWDLKTGRTPQSYEFSVPVFPLTIEGDDVFVDL